MDAPSPESLVECAPELTSIALVESEIREEDLQRGIDIVFVSEGYRVGELDLFRKHCRALIRSLGQTTRQLTAREPDLFNFHMVLLPSSTGDVDDSDVMDTALGAHESVDELDGSIMIRVSRGRLWQAARHAPAVDVAVAVVNGAHGRANAPGSTVVLSSRHACDNDGVFAHELGHALFGLADEYADVDACYEADEGDLLSAANLTRDPSGSKWAHLVSGAEEGGRRHGSCVYHPTKTCKMRRSDDEFCSVCAAEIESVLALYKHGHTTSQPRIVINSPAEDETVEDPIALRIDWYDRSADDQMLVTLNGHVAYEGPRARRLPISTLGASGPALLCVSMTAHGADGESCRPIVLDPRPWRDPPTHWPDASARIDGARSVTDHATFLLEPAERGGWPLLPTVIGFEVAGRHYPAYADAIFGPEDRGPLSVTVFAEDDDGVRAKYTGTFEVRDPYLLGLQWAPYLEPGARLAGTVPILVELTGRTHARPPDGVLQVGDVTVPLSAGSTEPTRYTSHFLTFIDTLSLPPGEIEMRVRLSDAWGRVYESTRKVTIVHHPHRPPTLVMPDSRSLPEGEELIGRPPAGVDAGLWLVSDRMGMLTAGPECANCWRRGFGWDCQDGELTTDGSVGGLRGGPQRFALVARATSDIVTATEPRRLIVEANGNKYLGHSAL